MRMKFVNEYVQFAGPNIRKIDQECKTLMGRKTYKTRRPKPTVTIRFGADEASLAYGGQTFDISGLDDDGMIGLSKDICHLTGIGALPAHYT